jgi:hypothetical protein
MRNTIAKKLPYLILFIGILIILIIVYTFRAENKWVEIDYNEIGLKLSVPKASLNNEDGDICGFSVNAFDYDDDIFWMLELPCKPEEAKENHQLLQQGDQFGNRCIAFATEQKIRKIDGKNFHEYFTLGGGEVSSAYFNRHLFIYQKDKLGWLSVSIDPSQVLEARDFEKYYSEKNSSLSTEILIVDLNSGKATKELQDCWNLFDEILKTAEFY